MEAHAVGSLLLELARYALLAEAIIGAMILAGLIIWRQDFKTWTGRRGPRSHDP